MTDAAIMLMDPRLQAGRWPEAMRSFVDAEFRMTWRAKAQQGDAAAAERKPYSVQHGVAVFRIDGPTAKDPLMWLFGGTDSVGARNAIRAATMDPEVGSMMIFIDSPGGEVPGTEELGAAVAEARQSMPVHVHIEGMGASAAYWVASQASTITAESTAWVGSVGTLMVIPDTSGMWEKEGVKWHVIASPDGEEKGLLQPKAGITEKDKAYAQSLLDPLTAEFKAAISRGRGRSAKWADSVATGRMWGAREALELGLIDGISLRDAAGASAMQSASATLRARNKSRAERVVRRTAAAAGLRRIRPDA